LVAEVEALDALLVALVAEDEAEVAEVLALEA
jgi:hypothetical protein